jgi:hypothetical protein
VETDFWLACGLLSKGCLFTYTSSLGYDKSARPVPADHVQRTIGKISSEGRLDRELTNALNCLLHYRKGLALLEAFGEAASTGRDILDAWVLAARNLVNRAEATVALLGRAKGCDARFEHLLETMRLLREETGRFYQGIIKPARRREMMEWMYGSMEAALSEAAGQ